MVTVISFPYSNRKFWLAAWRTSVSLSSNRNFRACMSLLPQRSTDFPPEFTVNEYNKEVNDLFISNFEWIRKEQIFLPN